MYKSRNNILLMLIYVIFSVLIFYYYDGGIKVGSFTVMYRYMFAFVLIVIGLFYALAEADITNVKILTADTLIHGLPYVFGIVVSYFIWAFKFPGRTVITRGTFYVVYTIIALLLAYSYVIVFKRRSVYVLLASSIIAYLIIIYKFGIAEVGLSEFISETVNQVIGFGLAEDNVHGVEYAAIQWIFGCLLLYFLLDRSGNVKKRFFFSFISLLFLLVGLKRITIPGVIAGYIFALFIGSKEGDADVFKLRFLAIAIIIFLAGYVVFCKYNILELIYTFYGIDTKGRTDLMDTVDAYYRISPLFTGYGFAYFNRLLETLYAAGVVDSTVLHNDILRNYIELGFFGYIIWSILFYFTRLNFVLKHRSKNALRIAVAIIVYLTVTYLTDNTFFYFNINLAAFIVMFAADIKLPEQVEEQI